MFRGDDARDAEGYLAVFSDQGTSAPHLEAAKMMDALARLSVYPDDGSSKSGEERSSQEFDNGECDGEDADAVGAYTQALRGGPKTWITIPRRIYRAISSTTEESLWSSSCWSLLAARLSKRAIQLRLGTSKRMGMPLLAQQGSFILVGLCR